jgi:hypothetical protein
MIRKWDNDIAKIINDKREAFRKYISTHTRPNRIQTKKNHTKKYVRR